MQTHTYIFHGNSDQAVDRLADRINTLPYDVVFTQFEGNEEAFFSFSMETYYEEYDALVLSMVSLIITEFSAEVSAVSKLSNYSFSTMNELALAKQIGMIDDMLLECGFKMKDDHDHGEEEHAHEHHHHDHDCDCGDDCECGHDHDHDHECTCGHDHHVH